MRAVCHVIAIVLLIIGGGLMLASFIGRDTTDYKLFNAGFCLIFICILYLLYYLLDIIFNCSNSLCSNCLCSYYYRDKEQQVNYQYSDLM